MPHTQCKEVYFYSELNPKAKERARDWYREGALDYDWWDFIYEDAERIGLTITSFDLDRNKHCKGKLTLHIPEVWKRIQGDHGEECETYKTLQGYAIQYEALAKALEAASVEETEELEQKIDELTSECERELLEDYANLLQQEYEYRLSDAVVEEDIVANEYEFTEKGERV